MSHSKDTLNDMASSLNKLNVLPVTQCNFYCHLLCTHLVVLHDVQDQLPQCISRITAFFMQYYRCTFVLHSREHKKGKISLRILLARGVKYQCFIVYNKHEKVVYYV